MQVQCLCCIVKEKASHCFESAVVSWVLEHVLLPCYAIGRAIELEEDNKELQVRGRNKKEKTK